MSIESVSMERCHLVPAQTTSRRSFLETVSGGLYGSALLSLLQSEQTPAAPQGESLQLTG